jgi:hypothetical protein
MLFSPHHNALCLVVCCQHITQREQENERVISSMFATQWFITVYTYNMPFSIVLRMWDVFLQEVRPPAAHLLTRNSLTG